MMIGYPEASAEFSARTHSDALAASAYLPKVEYEHCEPCAQGVSHGHPSLLEFTQEQIDEAITLYFEDQYMEAHDL